MYKIWNEEFVINCYIGFHDTLVSCKQTGIVYGYNFVSACFWTCRTAVSFSGVIVNKSESNRMYCSVNVSTFLIAALEVGNLFCAKCR